MFNITCTKVGGIRFLKIGRINISFCVTSEHTYWTKMQERMDTVTMKALVLSFA